jgi:uncharacterized protein DUF1707
MLVSDADRDKVLERLKHAYVEGRLTLDELRDRTHLALTAREDHELARPLADLPGPALRRPAAALRRHPAGVIGTLLILAGLVLVIAAALSGPHGWPAPFFLFFFFWFFVPWRRRQRRRS